MFGAIYTGLSGMTAYSQGLDLISNNVANLNTPGFKVSDPLFREIVYRHLGTAGSRDAGSRPGGAGVQVQGSSISFRQGELRDTGNSLDAAIDGSGFFVLNKDGQYIYTRAGQFEFNDEGVLVERGTGAPIVVSTESSSVGFFDIDSARVHPPRATTEVTIVGTLARGGTTTTYELPNLTVYDSSGTAIALRARLVRDASNPLSWTVEILGPENAVFGGGAVVFNEDGTPAEGSSSITITVDSAVTSDFEVVFNFGSPGSFAGVTSPVASTASQLQMLRQDGLQVGSLSRTEFDERGQLKLTYSNGETQIAGSLLLAQFDAPEQLRALGAGLFVTADAAQPILGTALSSGFGRIIGSQLEMSNVELTQQFTDLIIMQRGYQASSQISSVANELIQTLLAMDGGR